MLAKLIYCPATPRLALDAGWGIINRMFTFKILVYAIKNIYIYALYITVLKYVIST